ncbi:purine nucleoside permease [Lentinus tigrinus ALCF2SS1-7]|uniref:purine nucleoside permease n=1 Tax=Lentinus tigrinus ALCF2SS1-7 TaxID=1328758 RepID=UPI001165EE7D|nr:purine nucleoside permease [Lentinus tigrinus ALCF2SS1-7]
MLCVYLTSLFLLTILAVVVQGAVVEARSRDTFAPKVFIISMFDAEGDAWHGIPEFNVLERNITIPGFSPLFPQAHCTRDGSICQLVTGEAEINAASTITALVQSPLFDLTHTYFLIAGIAGISPRLGTLGSVTFARFAVQVALQFEFDAREKPAEFSTGYVPQGSMAPDEFPQDLYGTEVFEVNEELRQIAIRTAKKATLFDDTQSQQYRVNYATNSAFGPGAAAPSVVACDTATSDVFWTGNLFAVAFENTTTLFTNGSATYCTTQQEDNATLEALMRGALAGRVDFSRIIVMRTGSDFDRPFDGQTAAANLFVGTPGFDIAIRNIRAAGVPIVTTIVSGWKARFERGVMPSNYVGDIFGSLGGTPNFGPGSIFRGRPALRRRSLRLRVSGPILAV